MTSASSSTIDPIRDFFKTLFDADVKVEKYSQAFPVKEVAVVARYANASGIVCGHLLIDVCFANSLGAALTRVSPSIVVQANKTQQIDRSVKENLQEVMNICANLFPVTGDHAVRLESIGIPPTPEDFQIAETRTSCFQVTIPRYPAGRFKMTIS